MLDAMKRWIAPPIFPGDEEKAGRAGLLNLVILISLAITSLCFLALFLRDGIPPSTVIIVFLWLLVLLQSRRWLYTGKLDLVELILSSVFFVAITAANISQGSVRSTTTSVYIFWVALVAMLYGLRGLLIGTSLGSLAVMCLIWGEHAGLLPKANLSVGVSQWMIFTALFAWNASLAYYTNQITRRALTRAESEIEQRKKIEDVLRESEAFGQSIFNSLSSQATVLDHNGVILAVNEPWRRLALENGLQAGVPACQTGVGVNYLEICDSGPGGETEDSVNATWGIRAIINGVLPTFNLEYPCHSATEQRWFRMTVTRIGNDRPGRVLVTHTDITPHVLATQEIERLVDAQKAMLENDLIGIVTVRNRWIVWANPAFEKMLGFGPGELAGVPNRRLYVSEEAYETTGRTAYPLLRAGQVFRSEIELVRKDGVHIWVDASGSRFDHSVAESLWGFKDVTQRKQMEDAIVLNEKRMELALAGGDLATWDWDIPSGSLIVNARWAELQGLTLEELPSRVESWETRVHPDDLPTAKEVLDLHFKGITPVYESEHRVLHKDGHWVWVHSRGKVVERDSDSNPVRMLGTAADISDRKQIDEQIRQLAYHDTLTNLPNRRLLMDRLSQAIAAGERSATFGALMFMDLDNFKPLNDQLGHAVGDLLLVEVARRLKACVRAVDTVSRVGGDEFVVLLHDLTADQVIAAEIANKLAEKILISLSQPYLLPAGNEAETIEHQCSASIGVVLFSKEHQDLGNLVKWADATMYLSKKGGRNRITLMTERRAEQRI